VQAWLVEPDGDGPHPTIVEVHGGPHWAFTETYDGRSQAWADHGYAWLGVNQRGSTGFGAAFAEQIWGDLGHWELEDAAAGRAWLIEQGIARPGEILIFGGSFGGYLTLLAAGKQPDLWAGAMAFIAIGDLVATYEEMSPALRGALTAWMRGTPAERPSAYAASSPITYAEWVAAPVLVIQGRNDSRTTAGQLIKYEQRLRALGKEIEVDWFDAGHQSIGPQLWVRFQERVMVFADRVLARSGVAR
jgi:dipeptidyl aminopeptidase/acylaminoacyl peptidase